MLGERSEFMVEMTVGKTRERLKSVKFYNKNAHAVNEKRE